MRVYHRVHTGRPLRIAWVLEEIGEPYELTVMDSEEGRGEEHRTRHPLGRVPVLEDDDGLLFESAAICLHLADRHPDSGLLAAPGTRERALAYQWVCFAPAELEPALFETWSMAERDPERAASARRRFDAAAGAVEAALDGQEYLVANSFGVADVLVGTAVAFTTRAGFADELPVSLKEYVARLAARPAFQRATDRVFGSQPAA
jgi:glutathione S-transferase